METWTHREYMTRLHWVQQQWNEPDRTDHYLMQIAQEVRRVLSKKPNSIKLDHFKLPFIFKRKGPKLRRKTREKAAKTERSIWTGILNAILGRKDRKKTRVKTQPKDSRPTNPDRGMHGGR